MEIILRLLLTYNPAPTLDIACALSSPSPILKCLPQPVITCYLILLELFGKLEILSAFFKLKAEHPEGVWHIVGVPRRRAQ